MQGVRNQDFEVLLPHNDSEKCQESEGKQIRAAPALRAIERSSEPHPQCRSCTPFLFPLFLSYTHKAGLGPEDQLSKGRQADT